MNRTLRSVAMILIVIVIPLAACSTLQPSSTPLPPPYSPPTVAAEPAEPAPPAPKVTEDSLIHQNIAYIPGGDFQQKLSVYLPVEHASSTGEPIPVVVLAHGYTLGKEDPLLAETMHFLNQLGVAAVTVDYQDDPEKGNPWAAHNDVACGLAWVYANAHEYGLDVERMAAFGNSYGAQMLTNLTLADDPNLFLTDCPNSLPAPRPFRGMIPFGAGTFGVPGEGLMISSESGAQTLRFRNAADTLEEATAMLEELAKLPPGEWATSGELSPQARALAQTFPAYWVDAGAPPFLLLYPGQETRPQLEYDAFATLLKDAGVPYTYLVLPDAQHSAWGPTDPATWQEPMQQFLEEILGQ